MVDFCALAFRFADIRVSTDLYLFLQTELESNPGKGTGDDKDGDETGANAIKRRYQQRYVVAVPGGTEEAAANKVAVQIFAVHNKTAFDEVVETNDITHRFFAFSSPDEKAAAKTEVQRAHKLRGLLTATETLVKGLVTLSDAQCKALRLFLPGGVESVNDESAGIENVERDALFTKLRTIFLLSEEEGHSGDGSSSAVDKRRCVANDKALLPTHHAIVNLLTTTTMTKEVDHPGGVSSGLHLWPAVRVLLFYAARIRRQECEASIVGLNGLEQNIEHPRTVYNDGLAYDWDWRRALQKTHHMNDLMYVLEYERILI